MSLEKKKFLRKMLLEKPALRLAAASSLVLFGLATSAMADLIPYDPHALFASGGDATDIDSGQPIQLSAPSGSNMGGGIFVFHNNTGSPLSAVQVDINVPTLSGFIFGGTIFTPVSGTATVMTEGFDNVCGDPMDTSSACLYITFEGSPPIVPLGGNFVLDFDTPSSLGPPVMYGGVDHLVATGNYSIAGCKESNLPNCTGTTDTSDARIGEWPDRDTGFVTPIIATPEPGQYAGLVAGATALAIFLRD